MPASALVLNLGGEGEIPGVLNQQRPACTLSGWKSAYGKTFAKLCRDHPFLICPNEAIALPDDCVDTVYTNSVPIDTVHPLYGPGVQSSEIQRILKRGGEWIHDGALAWTKP